MEARRRAKSVTTSRCRPVGPGQLLVRVTAAAVNNTDIWTREGSYGASPLSDVELAPTRELPPPSDTPPDLERAIAAGERCGMQIRMPQG